MAPKKKRAKKDAEPVPEDAVSSTPDVPVLAASATHTPEVMTNKDNLSGMAKTIMVDLQSCDNAVLVAAMGLLAEQLQENERNVVEGIALGAHMIALQTMKRNPYNKDIHIDGCTVIQMLTFLSTTRLFKVGNTIREALTRAGCFEAVGKALQRFPASRTVQFAGLGCLVNLVYGCKRFIDDNNRRMKEGRRDTPATDFVARWQSFAHDHAANVVNAMEQHEDNEVEAHGVRLIWNLTLHCKDGIWDHQPRVPAIVWTARHNFPEHRQIEHFAELFFRHVD